MSLNGREKHACGFFDKTIITICICLITPCVNLQPFRFDLARFFWVFFNAVSRWAEDFLSRASIYFLKLLFSGRSVCLVLFLFFFSLSFLWGLILVPAGRSHLENTEYGERRGERWSEGGWRAVCVCVRLGGGGTGKDKIDKGKVNERRS